MKHKEVFQNKTFNIELVENDIVLYLLLKGRSIDREPSLFMQPIFDKVLEKIKNDEKEIIIDVRDLLYMVSSTITPIIRLLEKARQNSFCVTVLYWDDIKWQKTNFSALNIFATEDESITVKGILGNESQ